MSEPKFSKRAESTLELLHRHPTKAPTVIRSVSNTRDYNKDFNWFDGDRRSPRPRTQYDAHDSLGCLASLPVALFRKVRGL